LLFNGLYLDRFRPFSCGYAKCTFPSVCSFWFAYGT